MDRDIERICKSCSPCQTGKMRREKIKSEFDALGPQSKAGPRQHYGMDFYGLMKGEVLVIVNLFTRETILQWLPSRRSIGTHWPWGSVGSGRVGHQGQGGGGKKFWGCGVGVGS
jgi:hypothetical protein